MSRVLAKQGLVPHPSTPLDGFDVAAALSITDSDILKFEYVVTGDIARLKVPEAAAPSRADELWQSTCFEAFLRTSGTTGYTELNFSPARQWASYGFEDYRAGMKPLRNVSIEVRREEVAEHRLAITAYAELGEPFDLKDAQMGLSAVLEELDGTKSYWALVHPPGKPDFHHPACFALNLAAPDSP